MWNIRDMAEARQMPSRPESRQQPFPPEPRPHQPPQQPPHVFPWPSNHQDSDSRRPPPYHSERKKTEQKRPASKSGRLSSSSRRPPAQESHQPTLPLPENAPTASAPQQEQSNHETFSNNGQRAARSLREVSVQRSHVSAAAPPAPPAPPPPAERLSARRYAPRASAQAPTYREQVDDSEHISENDEDYHPDETAAESSAAATSEHSSEEEDLEEDMEDLGQTEERQRLRKKWKAQFKRQMQKKRKIALQRQQSEECRKKPRPASTAVTPTRQSVEQSSLPVPVQTLEVQPPVLEQPIEEATVAVFMDVSSSQESSGSEKDVEVVKKKVKKSRGFFATAARKMFKRKAESSSSKDGRPDQNRSKSVQCLPSTSKMIGMGGSRDGSRREREYRGSRDHQGQMAPPAPCSNAETNSRSRQDNFPFPIYNNDPKPKPFRASVTPEGEPDPYDESHEYVYLKTIRLFVNGNCPDQFQGGGDRYEAPFDYIRMLEVQGLMGKNVNNSITPNLFNRNFYLACWNLSCTPNPSTFGIQPTVPNTTQMHVKLEFSAPLPHDLQMVVWTQFSSCMTIDKARFVGLSSYNVYNK